MAMLVCIAAMSVFTSCKDEKSNAELILGKRNVDKILSTVQKQQDRWWRIDQCRHSETRRKSSWIWIHRRRIRNGVTSYLLNNTMSSQHHSQRESITPKGDVFFRFSACVVGATVSGTPSIATPHRSGFCVSLKHKQCVSGQMPDTYTSKSKKINQWILQASSSDSRPFYA